MNKVWWSNNVQQIYVMVTIVKIIDLKVVKRVGLKYSYHAHTQKIVIMWSDAGVN